ncbi:MAG TPA: TlpA disulfide reductase family protein [Elusimicrobiota bacterium]|nr:TlpA disulfide reductase family protein [Elusimicrobiota bacterium]
MKNPPRSAAKKFGLALLLSAAAVAVYFLAARRPAPPPPPADEAGAAAAVEENSPNPDEKAPRLTGPALRGKTVSLSDYAGKIVLVDFWATWCEPCQEEIPDLVKLRDKLKDKGFEILGVSMDEEGAKAVEKFVAKQPISYPVILNGGESAPAGWDVPGLPTAYLIGRRGEVLKRWFGEKDMPALEKDVTAALAK